MAELDDILTGALAAGFVVLALWLAAPWWQSVPVPKCGGENPAGTVQKGMASRYGIMTRDECRIAFGGHQPTGPCPDNPEPPTGDTAITMGSVERQTMVNGVEVP